MEFLIKRKLKVVANGSMFDEDVASAEPQGTVLASVLLINISDIDQEVKESIVK